MDDNKWQRTKQKKRVLEHSNKGCTANVHVVRLSLLSKQPKKPSKTPD